jgi:hypothetical protein
MTAYFMYRIYSLTNDKVYVGSTIDFYKRRIQHKFNCYNEKGKYLNNKLYRTIRQYDGWEFFIMEIIEILDCKTNKERFQREQELMIIYNSNLNTNKAYLTEEQKKQYTKQYKKQYKIDNKDKINIYRNRKFDCCCGGKFLFKHKSRHNKTNIHRQYELEKQTINNITNNYNITNLTIQQK